MLRCEVWARQQAAINRPAINAVAINNAGPVSQPEGRPDEEPSGCERGESLQGSASTRTPNRRSREAYNAYMRGYMRKRRAS